MKKLIFSIVVGFTFFVSTCQVRAQEFSALKVSPGDVEYYPNDAAYKGLAPVIRIDYFRPLKKGRAIFGTLVKYGEVWRAGANIQTRIQFYKDVQIGGKDIPAGVYSLFIVPTEKEWTLVINKQKDRMGAYSYDKNLDVIRVSEPVKATPSTLEAFSITVQKAADGATLYLGWDNIMAGFPIKF